MFLYTSQRSLDAAVGLQEAYRTLVGDESHEVRKEDLYKKGLHLQALAHRTAIEN